jgi:hypothetical protein
VVDLAQRRRPRFSALYVSAEAPSLDMPHDFRMLSGLPGSIRNFTAGFCKTNGRNIRSGRLGVDRADGDLAQRVIGLFLLRQRLIEQLHGAQVSGTSVTSRIASTP